jgi:hypothetical protein
MSNVSNLYAAKVYSEHPLAIWPLDDDVSYVSLITNEQRSFEAASPYSGWTVLSGSANDSLSLPNEGSPFISSIYSGIQGSVPAVNGTVIEAKSPDLFLFSDCSQELETFSIGMYLYQDTIYSTQHEFGYEYYDDGTSSWIEVLSVVDSIPSKGWIHLQDTFTIQEFDLDYCRLIFRSTVNTGGTTGDYNFIFNGITVGQWSETTSSESLGATVESPPLSSGISNNVVPADQYGVLSESAYYVVESGKLLAKNEGIPMIFGSENVTKIYPSTDGTPSLIFPNKTMFSESGRYKSQTLEFWLKIRPLTKESRRIVGPLDTNDGVYVSAGFITLVVDSKFVSHNVSSWYRPMIIHLSIKNDTVSMIINGEQVGQISVNKKTMALSQSSWMGVYSYEDIDILEIDCISISPYAIPLQLSKKRFVWGQGVDPLELVNDSFDGEESIVNFSNSNYTANKIYPDVERWDAGHYNNLVATTNSISVPEYALPDIYLGGRGTPEWYLDNKALNSLLYPLGNHPLFFTFRPNIESSIWEPVSGTNWTEPCYLNFQDLTFLANPVSAIYGIFEVESEVLSKRPLIHIVNTLNNKRFEINITGYDITYEFDGQELPGTAFSVLNEHFVVGFNIPQLSENFNYELSSFFSSPEVLSLYIGGDGVNTFEGKIYRIGFADQKNFSEISEYFQESGISDNSAQSLIELHYSSYTLSPFFRYGTYFLDISVSSEWEEYFPLSYFSSYITKRDGSRGYDLDYLQFNFGYPSLIEIIQEMVDNPDWIYQQLFEAYNDPIQKSYEMLDNEVISGHVTYSDLSSNIVTEYKIDTTQSSLDAYATFQLLAEGADEPLSSFIYSKTLTDSYTVYANEQNTNLDPYKAYKTKFGVIDGTIIYPPKNINFKDVAVVIHLKIEQDGIISNPLKIKNLEITSRSLNENGLTPIGTKTGNSIYPYVKNGIYYSGKSKNPVMINKDSLPYLYTTETSGIRVLEKGQNKEYGVSVPINKSKSDNYLLGAFQLFLKYDQFKESVVPQVMFSLLHGNGVVEFLINTDQTLKRFKITARDQLTRSEYPGISFYQNGIKITNPYLSKNEWNVISVLFDDPIDLSSQSGSINLLSGCTYNNISFFKSTGLNQFGVIVPRLWQDVLYGDQDQIPGNIVDWAQVYDEGGLLPDPNDWKSVYVLGEAVRFSTTPKEIYSTYMGTNIIVVDDDTGVSVTNDDFSVYADQTWLSIVNKPV